MCVSSSVNHMTVCKHASNWNGWCALGGFSIKSKVFAICLIGNHIYFVQFKNACTHKTVKLYSALSHAITRLLLVHLFLNSYPGIPLHFTVM